MPTNLNQVPQIICSSIAIVREGPEVAGNAALNQAGIVGARAIGVNSN